MFRFEKLEVWQRSVDFASSIYEMTAQFPSDERFGLTSQMRRAAVSISSNIAEGSGRGSDAYFARFTQIAYGSLMEVVSQIRIALRQEFVNRETHDKLVQQAEQLARMLSGLRASLYSTDKTS